MIPGKNHHANCDFCRESFILTQMIQKQYILMALLAGYLAWFVGVGNLRPTPSSGPKLNSSLCFGNLQLRYSTTKVIAMYNGHNATVIAPQIQSLNLSAYEPLYDMGMDLEGKFLVFASEMGGYHGIVSDTFQLHQVNVTEPNITKVLYSGSAVLVGTKSGHMYVQDFGNGQTSMTNLTNFSVTMIGNYHPESYVMIDTNNSVHIFKSGKNRMGSSFMNNISTVEAVGIYYGFGGHGGDFTVVGRRGHRAANTTTKGPITAMTITVDGRHVAVANLETIYLFNITKRPRAGRESSQAQFQLSHSAILIKTFGFFDGHLTGAFPTNCTFSTVDTFVTSMKFLRTTLFVGFSSGVIRAYTIPS